jgi:chromosomal replication initiator protein
MLAEWTDSTLMSGLFSLPLASLDAAQAAVPETRCALPARSTPAFIAGVENSLVRVLAGAVERESLAFNPLVLYGPAGVGKSSVAHALAASRRERFGLTNVIATTAADLARSLAHAVETASTADFRTRHHRCDLLFVDDTHQLAGKLATQQFLLATLDALVRRGSLVIVTLRQPPQATSGLLPALASRLAGGLVAELSPPGFAARCELVRQAAAHVALPLNDQAVERLAGSSGNFTDRFLTAGKIRQAVLRLASETAIGSSGQKDHRQQLAADDVKAKSIYRGVCLAVARHFGLTVGELKGKSRQQNIAEARSLAMYLSRLMTSASYATIGKHFGGRDHTTVLHACRKQKASLENDDSLRRLADELATQIASEGAV